MHDCLEMANSQNGITIRYKAAVGKIPHAHSFGISVGGTGLREFEDLLAEAMKTGAERHCGFSQGAIEAAKRAHEAAFLGGSTRLGIRMKRVMYPLTEIFFRRFRRDGAGYEPAPGLRIANRGNVVSISNGHRKIKVVAKFRRLGGKTHVLFTATHPTRTATHLTPLQGNSPATFQDWQSSST